MTHSTLEGKARVITDGLKSGSTPTAEAGYHAFCMVAVANKLAAPFLDTKGSDIKPSREFSESLKNAVEATSFLKSVIDLFARYPALEEAIHQQIIILHAALDNSGMEIIARHYHDAYAAAGRFDIQANVVEMRAWADAHRGDA